MPAVAPTGPVIPAVPAPARSRIAAAVIALALVPVSWWLAAHGEWNDAGWLVPVLIVASLVLNVVLARFKVPAPGPMALTTIAVFSAAMALFTTILYFVDSDLTRTLIAAVPAVLIAAFGGPGIQQGAADVNGEWIVAAGVAIVGLFVAMLLLKVQVSLNGLHDGSPEDSKPTDQPTSQVSESPAS